MLQIELRTRSDEYVTTVEIPPMDPLPEVIRWGSRIFVRRDDGAYCEGIIWVVA